MLEEAGFVVEACYGWFDRTPYRGGEDMIFVARRLACQPSRYASAQDPAAQKPRRKMSPSRRPLEARRLVDRIAAPVRVVDGLVPRSDREHDAGPSPAPMITWFVFAGQWRRSHAFIGRSSPSTIASASPARTRKSSWSASQWYIDIGSPGPSTWILIPSWSKSVAWSKPSNLVSAPRPSRSSQNDSRALTTNQPCPFGRSPHSVFVSLDSAH